MNQQFLARNYDNLFTYCFFSKAVLQSLQFFWLGHNNILIKLSFQESASAPSTGLIKQCLRKNRFFQLFLWFPTTRQKTEQMLHTLAVFPCQFQCCQYPLVKKNRRLQVTMIEVLQRISRKINMFSLR